jgi:hypothetical protein
MNPQDYEYPVDYLNQIAAAPKKRGLSNKKLFILGGGGIIAALLILLLLTNIGSGTPQALPTLAARLQTLESISRGAQSKLKDSSLRSTNSNLTLYLGGTNRDIAAPLKVLGVDPAKLDKATLAREKNQTLLDKLEDARLNGIYDRTYAREMNYELQKLTALMKQVYSSTRSTSLKKVLETTSTNLTPISDQFDQFTAASS